MKRNDVNIDYVLNVKLINITLFICLIIYENICLLKTNAALDSYCIYQL